MRLPDESDQHVASRGLVEHRLGVADRDDLAARFVRRLAQHLVDLAMTKGFEVRVRFVEKEHGAGVGGHVHEQQHGLLLAPAAGGEVEPETITGPVGHRDLASLGNVLRLVETAAEQLVDSVVEALPSSLAAFLLENSIAQVAQHLGGTCLTEADVDRSLIQSSLVGRKSGHRRQVGNAHVPCGFGYRHALAVFPAQGPAVEGLLVGVIEFEAA